MTLIKCSTCDDVAVFFRRYSGEKLCGRCFVKSTEERVQKTVSKYNMFTPSDTIAVAVSGGKDSVSLLHILHKIEARFPKSKLLAITVDEGIAGYKDEAVDIASDTCKILNLRHIITSFKEFYGYGMDEIVEVAEKKHGLTACTYCGVLRRKILNVTARNAGADKLATAHTLDDEIQTMFLNVLRGDVIRIFRTESTFMGKKLVKRVKPFCGVPEKEVAFYAFLKDIRFQVAACPYAGSSSRNEVRSFINRLEIMHPGTKFTVYKSFQKIQNSIEKFTEKVDFQECDICGEPAAGETCKACQVLMELDLLNNN